MGCVFRRCSGNLCFLGSNSRACGNKRMPAHAELYQPGELWVLKLFRAPCHSSGYPELIWMHRWNSCFRDPKKLLRWGCSASEGREGGMGVLRLRGRAAHLGSWSLLWLVGDVSAASLCWGYWFSSASGTTWKSWMFFQAQGSVCAMQWECFLKKYVAGLMTT